MQTQPDTDTVEFNIAAGTEPPRPFSSLVQVDFGALSDVGKVRKNNEDHYLVARGIRSYELLLTNLPEGEVPTRFDEIGYLAIVADGMGGMAAGEVASRMAIHFGVNVILNKAKWHQRIRPDVIQDVLDRMRNDLRKIDFALTEKAQSDRKLAGMGTTLTAAYSVGSHLFLAHVGDSRAYVCRHGKMHQVTQDHTFAQALADAGVISPEEVGTHRLRHVLTSALGDSSSPVRCDVQHLRLHDGDRLLLCSDGLTDMVEDAQIVEILREHETSSEACRVLVEQALERGGKDNVTVVLARYTFPYPKSEKAAVSAVASSVQA
jgi:protein phosphatase